MGATLRAPLAALMAMLELTANPHIILPGMLAVIVAEMTNSYLFKGESVFLAMIKAQGLDYRNDPITQSLRRISVASVMDRSFVAANKVLSVQQAKDILKPKPMWVLIEDEDKPKSLLRAADLVRYLDDVKENTINLMEIPGQRYDMIAINLQATLQEAKETLDKQGGEVLYVWRTAAPNISRVYGILTRQAIESNYR